MVQGNSQEIQVLKQELTSKRSRRQDTSRVESRLAEEEQKSQDLLRRLEEAEKNLASSEAQNQTLSKRISSQDALLAKKKALEFTDDELSELRKYSAIHFSDNTDVSY